MTHRAFIRAVVRGSVVVALLLGLWACGSNDSKDELIEPAELVKFKPQLKMKRVWSRDQLLDKVWGRDTYVDLRTVDVHVGRLRKVLNANGARDLIRTVRGSGYSLDSED